MLSNKASSNIPFVYPTPPISGSECKVIHCPTGSPYCPTRTLSIIGSQGHHSWLPSVIVPVTPVPSLAPITKLPSKKDSIFSFTSYNTQKSTDLTELQDQNEYQNRLWEELPLPQHLKRSPILRYRQKNRLRAGLSSKPFFINPVIENNILQRKELVLPRNLSTSPRRKYRRKEKSPSGEDSSNPLTNAENNWHWQKTLILPNNLPGSPRRRCRRKDRSTRGTCSPKYGKYTANNIQWRSNLILPQNLRRSPRRRYRRNEKNLPAPDSPDSNDYTQPDTDLNTSLEQHPLSLRIRHSSPVCCVAPASQGQLPNCKDLITVRTSSRQLVRKPSNTEFSSSPLEIRRNESPETIQMFTETRNCDVSSREYQNRFSKFVGNILFSVNYSFFCRGAKEINV